jgi:hypothetical protein
MFYAQQNNVITYTCILRFFPRNEFPFVISFVNLLSSTTATELYDVIDSCNDSRNLKAWASCCYT